MVALYRVSFEKIGLPFYYYIRTWIGQSCRHAEGITKRRDRLGLPVCESPDPASVCTIQTRNPDGRESDPSRMSDASPSLFQFKASVFDAGPKLKQRWAGLGGSVPEVLLDLWAGSNVPAYASIPVTCIIIMASPCDGIWGRGSQWGGSGGSTRQHSGFQWPDYNSFHRCEISLECNPMGI